jgi:hypothetical protein
MNWVYDCLILFLNYNNYIVVFTVIAGGKTFAFGKSLAKVIRFVHLVSTRDISFE